MATRADMLSKLRSLQGDFAGLVRCIDEADAVAAGKFARQMLEGMKGYLESIQGNFTRDAIENRLFSFDKDQEYVAGFNQKPPTRQDLDDLNRVAVHIAKHLRALDRLTDAVYPKPAFPWKTFIRAYGLRIATAAVGLAVIIGGIFAYRARVASRHGLVARYYADMELTKLAKEVREDNIDFPWGYGGPLDNWRRSEFSAQWTGFINVPFDSTWDFYTHNDDGVRLYIGNALIIDEWNRHATKINRAQMKLEAGWYPFRLDFFEHRKRSLARLFWKSASDEKPSIVPTEAFTPERKHIPETDVVHESVDPSAVLLATVITNETSGKPDAKPGQTKK